MRLLKYKGFLLTEKASFDRIIKQTVGFHRSINALLPIDRWSMKIKLSHIIFTLSFAILALFTVNFSTLGTSLFEPMMGFFIVPFIGLLLASFSLSQKLTANPSTFTPKEGIVLGTVAWAALMLCTTWNSFVYVGVDFYTSSHFIIGVISPTFLYVLILGRCVWLKYKNELDELLASVSN